MMSGHCFYDEPKLFLMVSQDTSMDRVAPATQRMRAGRLAVQYFPHGEPRQRRVSNYGNRPSTHGFAVAPATQRMRAGRLAVHLIS